MNTPTIQHEWEPFRARVKEAFDKLTDDDLAGAEGNTEGIVRAIQQRYDYSPSQAEVAWDVFMSQVSLTDEAAAMQEEDTADPARDAQSPYDPHRPAPTPEGAQARELAQLEAHNARREF